MRRMRIIHRNLKLDNILVKSIKNQSEIEIVVADLGLAVFTPSNQKIKQKCGTPGYIAPEVFSD